MKPSMLLAVVFVTGLVACTGGTPTSAPTAPSQASRPTLQPTPPVQSTNALAIAFTVIASQTLDQPTTFVVLASSSVNARLDFGDGDEVAFDLEDGAKRTLKHVYSRGGTFVVTLMATNSVGESSTIGTTLVVP